MKDMVTENTMVLLKTEKISVVANEKTKVYPSL